MAEQSERNIFETRVYFEMNRALDDYYKNCPECRERDRIERGYCKEATKDQINNPCVI